MTKEQMIAALGGNPENQKTGKSPVTKYITEGASNRITRSFFQDDKQKAFFDTLAILSEEDPGGALSENVHKSLAHAVLLAHGGSILPVTAKLFGFTFTTQGFYPCCVVVEAHGIGMTSPKGFPLGELAPWGMPAKVTFFSPEVVVAKAKELTELYRKISDGPFSYYIAEEPEKLADVISSAICALTENQA